MLKCGKGTSALSDSKQQDSPGSLCSAHPRQRGVSEVMTTNNFLRGRGSMVAYHEEQINALWLLAHHLSGYTMNYYI